MMTVDAGMTGFRLAAGEPFLLQVAFQEMDGSPSDLTGRAFVLTFYKDDRSVVGKIDGEVVTGETFVRFEEDGRFCDSMYNQVVYAELDERLRYGRNRIAGGRVFVTTSPLTVASLDNASIGEFATRVVVREANPVGDKVTFTQSVVTYAPPNATPAPSVIAKPTISTDGSPQVGEPATGNSGIYQGGSVAGRAWLLNGSVIDGADDATEVPQAEGPLIYREVVSGPGGTINADSDPVMVSSASGSTVAIDPLVTRSGNVYTFTARRSTNLSNAETRTITVAGSTNHPPAANANDFGGSVPSATASFAAGSATASFSITSAAAQPE